MKGMHIIGMGWTILLGALLINIIVSLLGGMTWYTYLALPRSAQWYDYVFLYALYPFLLGLLAFMYMKLLKPKEHLPKQ